MTAQTKLYEILRSLQISCDDVEYSFTSVKHIPTHHYEDILGIFKEDEGITIIASKEYYVTNNLPYEDRYAKLTVGTDTAVEFPGLTSVLASILIEHDIPSNSVAAFYHDHLFVRYEDRGKAIEVLNSLKQTGSTINFSI